MLHLNIYGDGQLKEKTEEAEVKHSVIPIGTSKPIVNISYTLPPDEEEAIQKKWDRLLSDQLDIPYTVSTQQARQQVADEMNEEMDYDLDQATLHNIINNPEIMNNWREVSLMHERWMMMNHVDPSISLESKVAEKEALYDLMNDPQAYQYIKTGDEFEDTANSLTMHELLSKYLALKLKDISTGETYSKRLVGDTGATMIGTVAAGPIGAAVGYIGYQAIGMGKGSVSVNTVVKEFVKEFNNILPNSTSKVEAAKKLQQLIDNTFTPDNREYWNDFATGILEGPRAYLDSGLFGGTAIGETIKGIGTVAGRLFHKARTQAQATAQAVDEVLEGEIVTNKALSLKDPSEPNGGADPRVIDLQYVGSDDGVARWSYEGFKRIASGETTDVQSYNNIVALDFNKYLSGVDKRDYVTPSNGYLDFDMALDMKPVHYVGGGSDGKQTMSFTKAVQKAYNINQQALKDRNAFTFYTSADNTGTFRKYRAGPNGYEELMSEDLIKKGWWKPYEATDIQRYIRDEYKRKITLKEAQQLDGMLGTIKERIAKRVIKDKQSLTKAFEDELKVYARNNENDIIQLSEGDFQNNLFIRDMMERFLAPTKNVKMPRAVRYELKDADKIYYEGQKNTPFVRKAVAELKKEGYKDYDFISRLGSKGIPAMVTKDGHVLLMPGVKKKKVGSVTLNKYGGALYESENIYKASGKRAYPMKYGDGYIVSVIDDFSTLDLDKPFNVKYNALINPKEIEVNVK